ncbi:hypothetical protein [Vagococcus salmoninarum]|uniref:hypothetical protein n=1 Tax=Vagococcus salmoninarum TaxID=2739 RepID=UPI00187E2AE7|nr:hypothetical protein [Vagococcus salmoninarum]MBE9389613.1 hypothetical protein [Vagococcus salmoninarum]
MKKSYLAVGAMIVVLFLSGCQKPEEARKSGELLISHLIYNQESKEFDEVFELSDLAEKSEKNDLVSLVAGDAKLTEKQTKEVKKISEVSQKNLVDKTEYTLEVLKEESGKAELEYTIKGLAEVSDKTLEKALDKEFEKESKKLTAETTDAEVQELVTHLTLTALLRATEAQTQVTKEKKVKLTFLVDPTNKKKWLIQNQDKVISELIEAFGY